MADNCSKYSTYRKQRRVVGASAWEDVLPVAYSIDGDGTMPLILIESGSSDCCGSDPDTGDTPSIGDIKWEVVSNNYYCDGTTKKQMLQKYQWNGTQWIALQEFMAGDVIEYESTDCGFIPSTGYSFTWQDGTTAKTVSIGSATTSDIYAVISTYDGLDHGYRVVSYPFWTNATRDLNSRTVTVSASTNNNANDRSGTVVLEQADSENEITLSITQSGTGSTPPPHDYSQDYFKFVALENSTVTFTPLAASTLYYSIDEGQSWNILPSGTSTPTVNVGQTIWMKGNLTPKDRVNGSGSFSSTGRFYVEGNIMSLEYGDDFADKVNLSGKHGEFKALFSGMTGLTSAENLVLPATTLSINCYGRMFEGCTSLTTAPELPATTLTGSCYQYMFQGCTSLTTAPELPATVLSDSCYQHMFEGCTSLTEAPELPATDLHSTASCYDSMFSGCTSLTTAPELPSTSIGTLSYAFMFADCTNLTTAPELPATYLSGACSAGAYEWMFYNCTSLTTAPELPATTVCQSCYKGMFFGCTNLTTAPSVLPITNMGTICCEWMFCNCTSLTTAPELPATTLVEKCYYRMFESCTNLSSVTCLATNISATDCTKYWLSGVSAAGTFTKAASMTDWTTGGSGIPSGWTTQNA